MERNNYFIVFTFSDNDNKSQSFHSFQSNSSISLLKIHLFIINLNHIKYIIIFI